MCQHLYVFSLELFGISREKSSNVAPCLEGLSLASDMLAERQEKEAVSGAF